jgi:archaellum component FlaC
MLTKTDIQELLEKERKHTMSIVKAGFEAVEVRIDGLQKRFDGMEKRFDGLEKKVDTLTGNVNDLMEQVQEVLEKAVTREELDQRLKPVEEALDIPHPA